VADSDLHPYGDCWPAVTTQPCRGAVPEHRSPEIQLQATYPAPTQRTLEQAVATPIEQQINGVDKHGLHVLPQTPLQLANTMVVDFGVKTDPNTDLILAQSREQLATGSFRPK